MTTGPERHQPSHGFMEAHQDRIAGRGLGYLILLNGIAAIVIVAAFVFGFQISAEPKLAAAMVVFGTGAIAGLVSSFIAYLNRIVRAEMPERPRLPNLLRLHRYRRGHRQRRGLPLRSQHGRHHLDRQIELAGQDQASGQGPGPIPQH